MTESETFLIETTAHVIEVSEGYLTIDTKRFPDACVCLRPQEAEEVLQALLWWKYGSHARAVQEQHETKPLHCCVELIQGLEHNS